MRRYTSVHPVRRGTTKKAHHTGFPGSVALWVGWPSYPILLGCNDRCSHLMTKLQLSNAAATAAAAAVMCEYASSVPEPIRILPSVLHPTYLLTCSPTNSRAPMMETNSVTTSLEIARRCSPQGCNSRDCECKWAFLSSAGEFNLSTSKSHTLLTGKTLRDVDFVINKLCAADS